jgi:hypothetical protein
MDTMKILLGATVALLFGALIMSWKTAQDGVRNTPAEEMARFKKEIDELRAQQDRLQLEKQLQELRAMPEPQVAPAATPSNAELEALRAEIAARDAALREIEAEKEKAERDATVFRDEAGLVGQIQLEGKDTELRRARQIRDALLIARVSEYVEEEEYGGFVTLDIIMPENVQIGTVLGIRRQTGILGLLKVVDISPEGAIANPMPGFGPIKPERGDELILPPQV